MPSASRVGMTAVPPPAVSDTPPGVPMRRFETTSVALLPSDGIANSTPSPSSPCALVIHHPRDAVAVDVQAGRRRPADRRGRPRARRRRRSAPGTAPACRRRARPVANSDLQSGPIASPPGPRSRRWRRAPSPRRPRSRRRRGSRRPRRPCRRRRASCRRTTSRGRSAPRADHRRRSASVRSPGSDATWNSAARQLIVPGRRSRTCGHPGSRRRRSAIESRRMKPW